MITLFEKKLTEALQTYQPYRKLKQRITEKRYPISVSGPKGSFLPFLISKIYEQLTIPQILVVPHEKDAEYLVQDISLFSDDVRFFPWWNNLPFSGNQSDASIAGSRICRLIELVQRKPIILVTSLRAFLTPLPTPEFITNNIIELRVGQEIDPIELGHTLVEYGYARVPSVTVIGEFALRGEVLDIFLPGVPEAVRVVFEFDTIEEIKHFDTVTQFSTEQLDSITLYPVREYIWTDDRIATLRKNLAENRHDTNVLDRVTEDLQQKKTCSDEEYLFPLSFEQPSSLLDYLSSSSLLLLTEYERLITGNETLQKEYSELSRKAYSNKKFTLPLNLLIHNFEETIARKQNVITFPALQEREEETHIFFSCDGPKSFFGNIQYLKEELTNLDSSGYELFVFTDSDQQKLRIDHLLKDTSATVITERISSGFTCPELKIAAIHENEIFGRKRRIPKSVKKARSQPIDTFVELNVGDFVVHINHGIGKFSGIERIHALGTERDYIKLEYADEETIFIPIEQVNLIQRYIGSENSSPRLDRIGGKSWEKRKNSVKKSVEDLAERLLKLYSQREMVRGHAFEGDTDWQIEFEASFPYEETEDQLRCIEEVKQDMEKERPMDRLICGDVGYGKTEVAMRAAFKAVTGGKQVAFLAPTTILAEQHYENFCERFKQYPVNIGMLSRFVSKSEQKKTIDQIKNGDVDIIIGTHRILQRDVHFKDLGLLVTDEEQRFGVKDKERLKELKHSVDCLTLTATPIPRTLHMSLLKIRDMSLLTTPPQNRLAIKTFIQEFDEETIVSAIRKEIEREGQAYFLHNRVETLGNVKLFLQKLLPELIIEMVHGQMSSHEIEDIMHRFLHGGVHVLVSTTIIENGIDIPNVNTIIIDRADMYGISQLYQLRGRVGRADKRAYAYLLYPEDKALSEIAMKRLQIISDYTELGSGFKIALKDLEVRGAGNLLGKQQHGDILSVGFDMYIRLLDHAIAEISEKGTEDVQEVYLDLEYSGYIPDSYISDSNEKMEIYKRIVSIKSEDELHRVHLELEDRFGPLPDEVSSLLSLAEIRIFSEQLHIASIKERKGLLEVEFAKVSKISADKVLRLIRDSGGSVRLNPEKPNVLMIKTEVIGLTEKSEFLRDKLSTLL